MVRHLGANILHSYSGIYQYQLPVCMRPRVLSQLSHQVWTERACLITAAFIGRDGHGMI